MRVSEEYEKKIRDVDMAFRKSIAKLNASEEEKEALRRMFHEYGKYIDLWAEAISKEEK